MSEILLKPSMLLGLVPFNHRQAGSNIFIDFILIILVPVFYLACYILVLFFSFGVYNLPGCDSICRLGNLWFSHLGCLLYISTHILTIKRGKRFFLAFERKLKDIDALIAKCEKVADETMQVKTNRYAFYFTWSVVGVVFTYTVFYNVREMLRYFNEFSFISLMVTTFPFLAASLIQGQFIYHVSLISQRFRLINALFDKINNECDKTNIPISVFDIESESQNQNEPRKRGPRMRGKKWYREDLDNETEDVEEMPISGGQQKSKHQAQYIYEGLKTSSTKEPSMTLNPTSETNLPDLFRLHDKILSLSVLTNGEFGPQCVPYMSACFVISIYAIFMETKVVFIAGGKSHLLDYVAWSYVTWSVCSMLVGYLVLRLCCNANGHSKQSAMIVHEIMQKKPAFMLGNDIYYNKMKAFTLQFLHWESYFHFNGIGLFALDYTFIFSTVSAATSYLIVLLQFDMRAILKNEGLI